MRLLILGGTLFVGRHLVETALQLGHEVTLFNRGHHHSALFPHVEKLRGDRDGRLDALKGRTWDAVIDTCGYVPRLVQASAELLKDAVGHYTFISSISVYQDMDQPSLSEESAIAQIDNPTTEQVTGETYGPLKALCEQALLTIMPADSLIIRPGLIVGPYDATDRFTYWPHRIAQGGEVLAPGHPDRQVQFIDVRDLVHWTLKMIERRKTGTYNATGPAAPISMRDTLEACRRVTQSNASFTWVPDEFLLRQGAIPYSEVPLWVPEEYRGFGTISNHKAIQDGLTFRPLATTIRDVLNWDASRPLEWDWQGGLNPEKERHWLELWQQWQQMPVG